MTPLVTVVIPTYNRAHLISQTIPTYLQRDVGKLVLVDDCSEDETASVAAELLTKYPGKIAYVKNDRNNKQTFSKNLGKGLCDSPYVYFGDDDSVLMPGSIAALLETAQSRSADITGAVALYCRPGQTVESAFDNFLRQTPVDDEQDYVDFKRLRFRFNYRPSAPIELPVTHAGFLIRRDWYRRFSFDVAYGGNCYREETDFLLSCKKAGAKILLDGRAAQVNLPPNLSSGGARSFSRLHYEYYSFLNTYRFLRKHRDYFREYVGTSYLEPILWFAWDRMLAAGRKLFQ